MVKLETELCDTSVEDVITKIHLCGESVYRSRMLLVNCFALRYASSAQETPSTDACVIVCVSHDSRSY